MRGSGLGRSVDVEPESEIALGSESDREGSWEGGASG